MRGLLIIWGTVAAVGWGIVLVTLLETPNLLSGIAFGLLTMGLILVAATVARGE